MKPKDGVWRELSQESMKTILQEKGDNSLYHKYLVHNFIPMPQAMKIPAAKEAVDKEWRKLEKILAVESGESQKQTWSDRRSKTQICESTFRIVDGHLSAEELWIRQKNTKNTKVESYSWVTSWRTVQALMQYSHWRFQNRCVQTIGYVYHDTNGQNHGPAWLTQAFLLKEICMVIFWQDRCEKGNLRKFYWSTVGKKFPVWECLFVHRHCVRGWHQIGWQERKHHSDVESTWQRSRFGRTNIIPWSYILGMYSKTLRKTQTYCWQCSVTVFESWISAEAKKLPSLENPNISTWSYDMEGHAKKCVERYCELSDKTTEQLHTVSTPCIDDHQFKEEELKSVGELSDVCSQIVVKCLYLARIG